MNQEGSSRWTLERLAPLAFVAGSVLLGLTLLAFTFIATAPGYGPIEDSEQTVVDDTAVLAYPVPVSYNVPTRIDVAYVYPDHAGEAMIAACADYATILRGGEPTRLHTSSTGDRGRLTTTFAPDIRSDPRDERGCGFLYVILRWEIQADSPAANRPDVQVTTSPAILPGFVSASLVLLALLGVTLTLVGATAWARRLARGRPAIPADEDESTTETLLLLVHESGDWLRRMRRYLIAAGVLGIFLWYPLVLPWAWRMAVQGSPGATAPWLFAAGGLGLLAVLTVVWARAYLRLDRQLVAWQDRVARLRDREDQMLQKLQAAG
ncbi:MAG: hypothetical protein KY455_12680 [Euryarchaeota archaeon]|nr:hypothetical protein [Euryarchaeota archaeon]